MRNSIAQGLFGAIIQLQPLPWDDSLVGDDAIKHSQAFRELDIQGTIFSLAVTSMVID